MYNLDRTTAIEQEDIEYILKPVLRSTRELLQLPIPDSLEEVTLKHELDMIEQYNKEATRIFQITPRLIGLRNLIEDYTAQMHIDENHERVANLLAKINLFVDEKLLLKIEVPEARLQLSPDFKLLITPLGVLFLHCYYSRSSPLSKRFNFDYLLFHANQLLGYAYNYFMVDRISHYLNQTKSNFSKREVILTLFLVLSQATSLERAIRLGRARDGDLLVPLRYISNAVFTEEPDLFTNRNTVDDAIRRSTGAGSLQGKTSMLFVKEKTQDKSGYLLYFDTKEARDALSFITRRLFESVKAFEEKDGNPYWERILDLVDKHVNDRNLIFELKHYIREKILLNPGITTVYLRNLFRVMRSYHS